MKDKTYFQKFSKNILNEKPFLNSTELAYELLLQEILSGGWRLGERIPQEELAVLFDMSRTPIRDALSRLEQEKFLEKGEKGGYRVCRIKLKDYIDFCEFRLCLETKAAYFAARNISEELLEKLKDNVEALKKVSPGQNFHKALLLDNEFHRIIAEASNNEYIYETIQRFRSKEIFSMQAIVQEHSIKYIVNKHQAIYEAIQDNDEIRAERAMQSHLQFYLKNILHVYE